MQAILTLTRLPLIGLLFGAAACVPVQSDEKIDLLIVGGTLVDGTGSDATTADVAIRGDRIVAIGADLPRRSAVLTIDAEGLVVAPGFIEPHGHITAIKDVPAPENFLRQGVTTIVNSLHSLDQPYPLAPFLEGLETAPNTVWTGGHTWLRKRVLGLDDREPTPGEMAQMVQILGEAMDDGAIGLGTGLEYIPAAYATSAEISTLAGAAQRPHAVYMTHLRDEGPGLLKGIEEAIQVSQAAGIALHVNHIKSTGLANAGVAPQVLRRLEAANAQGPPVSFDVYPYDAYSTYSTVLFPGWALAGGNDAFVQRIADGSLRSNIKSEMADIFASQTLGDPDSVIFRNIGDDWSYAGRTLGDWLRAKGREATVGEALDALIELQSEGGFIGIFRAMSDSDIDAFILHEMASISSDGDLVVFGEGFPHPRSYGAFPRVLGQYVRERRLLTLEEAIAKMTSRPADALGIEDRGRIAVGSFADIVIFDADLIDDRATFANPHQHAEGVVGLIINGVPVIQNGAITGALPGRALRRKGISE